MSGLSEHVRRVNMDFPEPSALLRFWWALKDRMPRPMRDAWIAVRDRFWCKWTTIKPRTLPHSWVDYGDQIPHLIFECLSRFMERDGGNEMEDDTFPHADDVGVATELKDHYHWWKNVFFQQSEAIWDAMPARNGFGSMLHDEAYQDALDRAGKEEKALEAELHRRCKRLIDLSGYMWS